MAVYFIRNTESGCIKIGSSGAPLSRLRQLQTASPHPLELIGTIDGGPDKERELHARFAEHRMSGEWFRREVEDGVMAVIKSHEIPQGEPPDVIDVWRVEGTEERGSTAATIAFFVFRAEGSGIPDPIAAYRSRAEAYSPDAFTVHKVELYGQTVVPSDDDVEWYCDTVGPPVDQTGHTLCFGAGWLQWLIVSRYRTAQRLTVLEAEVASLRAQLQVAADGVAPPN